MESRLDDCKWEVYHYTEQTDEEIQKEIDEYKQIEDILDSIDADGEDDILIEPLRELPTDAVPADSVQENRETED